MKEILANTEIGVKYYLIVTISFLGFLSFAFMSIAPKVWDDMLMFFFIPYIPLIISTTLCWDFFFEERLVHKVFGTLFIINNLFWICLTWNNIVFPF